MLVSKRSLNLGENQSRMDSDHASLTLATAHASYPDSKMRTENPLDAAQAWGQRQSHTTVTAYFSHSILPSSLDYVALFGLNRTSPTVPPALVPNLTPNEVRLIVDEYGPTAHEPRVVPAGYSVSNLSGGASGYEILNQVLNPPETVVVGGYSPASLAASNPALDSVVNITFDNTADRPYAGIQTLYIHARHSTSASGTPQLTVVLRQNGVDLDTLTPIEMERTFYDSSPVGVIYKYVIDADASLPSATLPIQLRITGETTGTASVNFYAVSLRTSVEGTLLDTGWQTMPAYGDRVGWAPRLEFPNDVGHFVIVQFSDWGNRTPSTEPLPPGFPFPSITQYIQTPVGSPFGLFVGRFTAGSALDLPLTEAGFNPRRQGTNQYSIVRTWGGFPRASRHDLTWYECYFQPIPQSERRLFGEIKVLFDTIGHVIPAVFVINERGSEGSAPEDQVLCFYALVISYDLTDLGLLVGNDLGESAPQVAEQRHRLDITVMDACAKGEFRSI